MNRLTSCAMIAVALAGCAAQHPDAANGLWQSCTPTHCVGRVVGEPGQHPKAEVVVDGSIRRGDAAFYATHVGPATTVVLASPGGKVREAITLGRWIAEVGAAVEVPSGEACESACTLLWAAAVDRTLDGELGYHHWSSGDLEAPIRAYLQDVGAPVEVTMELWTATPHESINRIDGGAAQALGLI